MDKFKELLKKSARSRKIALHLDSPLSFDWGHRDFVERTKSTI